MTLSKKSACGGTRHLSSRFYVFISSLTQCTFDSPSSHSFHGSNSSHSKDNGSGGRTYNIPNYATSYANEKSTVISVTFDEDKGTPKAIITILVIFLLFMTSIPIFWMAQKSSEKSISTTTFHDWSKQQIDRVRGDNLSQLDVFNETSMRKDKDAFKPQINIDSVRSEDQSRQGDKSTLSSYWDKPKPGEHCVRFGTREYTAQLWNLPMFTDWTNTCMNTKANINGVSIKPLYCQSKWPFGGVEGHWLIDFNEEDCTPHWGEFVDKGCIAKGSKTRRFQSRLRNIKRKQDWKTMCETAPADFQGFKNVTPKLCDDRGIWGIYGIWKVDDPNC